MKSKLLIIRKQSGSRNLLPNDFEESPLMFHTKKDNLLDTVTKQHPSPYDSYK